MPPKANAVPRDKNEPPAANEWGQLRAYLARNGVGQAQIKQILGDTIGGRTREQMADELRAWLRER